MTNSHGMPDGFMTALRTIGDKVHPNHSMLVVVGGNALTRAFSNLFLMLYPSTNFVMVGSMYEALAMLKRKAAENTKSLQ